MVVLGLAGALLGLVSAGRTWASATTTVPGRREVSVSGADVVPVLLPLALVALASWGAFLVLRTIGRRVVAVLGAAASVGALAAILVTASGSADAAAGLLSDTSAATVSTTAWPWVGAVGLAGCAVAFVVATLRGSAYPQMSRRYDRVQEPARTTDLWRALDDGHDPTV